MRDYYKTTLSWLDFGRSLQIIGLLSPENTLDFTLKTPICSLSYIGHKDGRDLNGMGCGR